MGAARLSGSGGSVREGNKGKRNGEGGGTFKLEGPFAAVFILEVL